MTIELVGEFLGMDTHKGLYAYFRHHYGECFPALRWIHRTTFVRHGRPLALKEELHRDLLEHIDFDPAISLIDSFPVPVYRFARAYRCRGLAEESAFGYDETTKQTFYGLKGNLRICWPEAIVEADLAPANVHDLRMVEELLEEAEGWALGDSNY